MDRPLSGKIAFVTGSGRGLGCAMADKLASLGADVAIHDIDATRCQQYGEAQHIDEVAARMTATLDRLSGGRLLINVVTGGDPIENKGDGIFLSHAERYEVTREFLPAYKALLAGETVNTHGRHIRIDAARRIGLIPDLPASRIVQAGNAAIEGATIALLSHAKRQELEEIVRTAIAIAEDEGLAGVSMRKIAERLGVTTMTLYRYVPGKEDLLDLMFDMGTGPPPAEDWPEGWREGLSAYLRSEVLQ